MCARAGFLLTFLLMTAGAAMAQPKTDVVTLANGDRITGEIKELERGRLEFSTDDAGTIYFEWTKIIRVEATRLFEILTTDGTRFLGSLAAAADRSLAVVEGGTAIATLPTGEVTNIIPIGASLWRKIDGSVDAGFTYTQSTGIAQTTWNSNTMYRRPAFLMRLTTSATLTQREDEEESEDRAAIQFSYVRYRGRRWFASGSLRFETNDSLGILLRSQGGGLVGLLPVNTNRAQLELGAGAVVNNEDAVETGTTQNIEALLTLKSSVLLVRFPENEFRFQRPVLPQPQPVGPAAATARCRHQARYLERFFRLAQPLRHVRQRSARSECSPQRRGRGPVRRMVVLTRPRLRLSQVLQMYGRLYP